MGQVAIYLDEKTDRKLKAILQGEKVSKAKWLAEPIRAKVATSISDPIVMLAGSWENSSLAETLRDTTARDADRGPP